MQIAKKIKLSNLKLVHRKNNLFLITFQARNKKCRCWPKKKN